jgi:hypothetical protein
MFARLKPGRKPGKVAPRFPFVPRVGPEGGRRVRAAGMKLRYSQYAVKKKSAGVSKKFVEKVWTSGKLVLNKNHLVTCVVFDGGVFRNHEIELVGDNSDRFVLRQEFQSFNQFRDS